MTERKETQPAGELIDEVVDRLMPTDDQNVERIPTGFQNLDEKMGGFPKGEVTVLSGRPSDIVKQLAKGIARKVSVHEGLPTTYFSATGVRNVLSDVLLNEANVPLYKAGNLWGKDSDNMLDESDQKAIQRAGEEFDDVPLYLDDRSIKTVSRLRERIEQLVADHGIELAIIDSVQIPKIKEDCGREYEIAEVVHTLKGVAKKQDIAILLLSEISDDIEDRSSHRPKLIDVGETDVITKLADIVLLIYWEYHFTGDDDKKRVADLIVGKNTHGPSGTVPLKYDQEAGMFEDYDDPGRYENDLFEER